jgi:hypothetical protein
MAFKNKVWMADITDVYLGVDHVYLAFIMDVFTRTIKSNCRIVLGHNEKEPTYVDSRFHGRERRDLNPRSLA